MKWLDAPEFAHLHYPLLFGIEATAIPFFVALEVTFFEGILKELLKSGYELKEELINF